MDGGVIFAQKAGEAVVYAQAAGIKAECALTVYDSGQYPVLDVDKQSAVIKKSKNTFVNCEMYYKRAKIDADLTYGSLDEAVATFKNGEIKGVGIGKTKVYVTGEYGFAKITREIAVEVSSNVDFTLDCARAQLALSAPSNDYVTEINVGAEVYKDDVKVVSPELEWWVDSDAVSVQNGLITALKATDKPVLVHARYSSGGEQFVCDVSVTVVLPRVKSAFSAETQLCTDDMLEKTVIDLSPSKINAAEINKITDVGANAEIPFTVSGSGIAITKTHLYSGERVWLLEQDKAVYEVDVKVVTRYLKTKSDVMQLKKFSLTDKSTVKGVKVVSGGETATGTYYAGYFELASDIDCEGEYLPDWGGKIEFGDNGAAENSVEIGFHGTLEGNGHKIYNYNTPKNTHFTGLFGTLGKNAVVRNIALCNVGVGFTSGALAGIMNGTVENVLITGHSIGDNWARWMYSGMACVRCEKSLKVTNMFVYLTDTENCTQKASVFGTLVYEAQYENVIGIGLDRAYLLALPYGASKAHSGAGISAYLTIDEMKQAGVDVASWGKIWDASSNIPALKPLK